MAVTEADVLALRAEGNAVPLDWSTPFPRPETCAELVGRMVYELKSLGQTGPDLVDDLELFCRAAEFSRTELRAARDVLRALNYGTDITKRLTAIARRARPRPPSWAERMAEAAAQRR